MPRRFHAMGRFALLLSVGVFVSAPAYGVDLAGAEPAFLSTTDSTAEPLKIEIADILGTVQVRTGEDQPWQRAEKGMIVSENAEFRTSLRSAVQIKIPPDQTITLDRLGTIKVLQAIEETGKLKTKIGMKYGRTRYDIESAGQEHEASIASPSSTLAIRGTKVSLYDQRPFPIEAVSLTGRALFKDAKKTTYIGKKNGGKLKVDSNSANAAQYALGQAVVDPSIALARSQSEAGLVSAVLSTGATVSYDQQKSIRVVTGGRPLTDKELIPNLPGVLNFVLRWTDNANLNLGVISPGTGPKRTVYPIGGYDVVASGGKIAFDHRGGPKGGIEVTSWPAAFPEGVYRIGVAHISGANTPATVDVFLNGKRVDIVNTTNGPGPVKTVEFTGEPINPAFGAGIAVGEVRLFPSSGNTGASTATSVKKSK